MKQTGIKKWSRELRHGYKLKAPICKAMIMAGEKGESHATIASKSFCEIQVQSSAGGPGQYGLTRWR
jgi:hypothetical protein